MNEIPTTEKPELTTGGRIAPIIPRNLEELARVAQAIITGGLVPNSYRGKTDEETKAKVMIGVMKAAEVGLPPITGINQIAIINGRPSIWGDGAAALVHNSGELEWTREFSEGGPPAGPIHEWPPDYTAVCEMKRKGNDEPVIRRFSVDDATRANLWGNQKKAPWINYPKRMLAARARSWCLRDLFADCLSGLSIAEESQDIPMRDVTPPDTSYLDEGAPALPAPDEAPLAASQDASEPIEAEAVEVVDAEPVENGADAPDEPAPEPAVIAHLRDQPTGTEREKWRNDMFDAIAAAPTEEALQELVDSHKSGLKYVYDRFATDGQNLRDAIDERRAQLNPLAAC